MLKAVRASLAFMTTKERSKWYFLTGLRAILSFLDLVGILAIGFVVTSTAIFLTAGSDPDRILEFAGLRIPAVNAQTLPWVSTGVLTLFLSKAIFSVILTKKAAFFVATVEARAAKVIAQVSFGGDLSAARKLSREEVMYAVQTGSPLAFNVLLNAVNAFFSEAILFLVICIGFLFIDLGATIAAVLYFGLIAFVMQFFIGSLMTKAGHVAAEGAVKANTAISDLLSVFRELSVLKRRGKYIEAIYRARVFAANSAATQYYLSAMPRYIIEAALLVGVALFVLSQALAGDVVKSAATLGVFLSGGFRLTAALLPLQSALLTINAVIAPAMKAHDILELGASLTETTPLAAPQAKEQVAKSCNESESKAIGVEFKSVSLTYPDSTNPALRDATFGITAGEQVALMGPSGAGKSTIADLLCSVLVPTSGTVRLSNPSPSKGANDSCGGISYVPQSPGLISGTILENVALAEDSDKIDRQRALDSLRQVNMGDLIEELPEGLDTPLGKLKDGLSGGQLQRIGLARALYTKPGLLVMDEATSALDADSEAEIQKALDAMRGKVTVVLIAHRLNTIQHADKVILVEGGQIKDWGTFKELIARNPSVERIVDLMRVEKD
jgi:ABC-type multidrug transport system fused ATPase/permease subunit